MLEDSVGRVLIGGNFSSIADETRRRIARLLPWGTLDPTFDPGDGPDGRVRSLALDQEGRILLAGDLCNYEEYLVGTDPAKWDTSGDLLSDGWKVDNGLDRMLLG